MVHQRVTLHIVQVFGLVDFRDHSNDCFYQYSSGVSPRLFSPASTAWFISSFCGYVFIYENRLVFVNAVVPLQLSARSENIVPGRLVPGRLAPESHNYRALPSTTVLALLGARRVVVEVGG